MLVRSGLLGKHRKLSAVSLTSIKQTTQSRYNVMTCSGTIFSFSTSSHKMFVPDDVDEHEYMMKQHGGDGLPLVVPTQERVVAMMSGCVSEPDSALGTCPPSHNKVTVENVAIAAVMAGCHPSHFNIVIAAVKAALSPRFNYHGNHATTMG